MSPFSTAYYDRIMADVLCRLNNAGVAGEGSREGYEQIEDADKFSQQLLRSEFSEWDTILKTNVTAQYVSRSNSWKIFVYSSLTV